jgi:hypothetical protein
MEVSQIAFNKINQNGLPIFVTEFPKEGLLVSFIGIE